MKGKRVKKENNKSNKTVAIIAIVLICLTIIGTILFYIFIPKVKDKLVIELGTKKELSVLDFIERENNSDKAQFITDMSQIDLSKVGEYDIKLTYKGKEYTSKLTIQDTIAPSVEFQDIEKPIGYEINAKDFIKSVTDASEETNAEVLNPEEINVGEFGEYIAHIKVEDLSGNQVEKKCKLTITYIASEFNLELGNQLKIEDIIYDMQKAGNAVKQEDIDAINKNGVGEYEIYSIYNGVEKITKIIIKDTLPPDLKLKDITIYVGQQVDDLNQFIESANDASKVTTNILTTPDFSKEGEQEITIEAVDEYGNKATKTAKLTIKQDKEGPVFSGLNQINITVGGSIDYKKGVTAKDEKDGDTEFTVDSGSVNTRKSRNI